MEKELTDYQYMVAAMFAGLYAQIDPVLVIEAGNMTDNGKEFDQLVMAACEAKCLLSGIVIFSGNTK